MTFSLSTSLVLCCLLLLVGNSNCANPFSGAYFYPNAVFHNEVQSTINSHLDQKALLQQVLSVSTAIWLDTIAKIQNISQILQGAQSYSASSGTPVVVTFVVYNLPDRDCSAGASNGEISCADANCTAGISQYKTQYIDQIYTNFSAYQSYNVRIVAIIEPDAIPNAATNVGSKAKCAQGLIAYKTGIAYAIQQFGQLPYVYTYLDAAHGGWIGWGTNAASYANVTLEILNLAGSVSYIQGFSTNVANYQPLGSNSSTDDPCKFIPSGNNANNEVHYVFYLDQALQSFGITGKTYVIDTSRDGVPGVRKDCGNWCNIKGAGLGHFPTSDTTGSGLPNIDAYVWIKTPGESDGTSDSSSPRFDSTCVSVDAYTPAPEAGVWFPDYFIMLCKNSPYLNQSTNSAIAVSAPFSWVMFVMLLVFGLF